MSFHYEWNGLSSGTKLVVNAMSSHKTGAVDI